MQSIRRKIFQANKSPQQNNVEDLVFVHLQITITLKS